jgi:NADH dehydrogenase
MCPGRRARVVITGANGAVGLAILLRGPAERQTAFVAAVRSERAAGEIRARLGTSTSIARISYDDPQSLRAAFAGASAVVHLAGVLVERPGSSYEEANVETTRKVVEAAKRSEVAKVVLVSSIGASESSTNRYWQTKGKAEALVRQSGVPYTVLRAPMLLGPGTEGSATLRRNTSRAIAMLIGGGKNLHQPLDVDDLARAAVAASQRSMASNRTLDVVGPVSLTERQLVEHAGHLLGRHPRVWSIPKGCVSLLVAIGHLATRGPGFSRDALDVITADTRLDPQPAATTLGIELTGLDEMIRRSLQPLPGPRAEL